MKFEWQQIDENDRISKSAYLQTWRAPVIGGWLILTKFFDWIPDNDDEEDKVHLKVNTIFIPDPDHEWEYDL